MEEREQALRQVDEYQRKKEEKKECAKKIGDCSGELAALKRKIDRLDLLKSNYEGYERFSQLELRLAAAGGGNLAQQFPRGTPAKG